MKAKYLRKGEKRWDVKAEAGDKLKHYNVTQGACSDGEHIYMVFERKKKHQVKIVKLKASDYSVQKVSGALKVGHGNDLCYKDGILYITHSGTSDCIHRVDAKTLKKLKDVKVNKPGGYNGITVYKDGFILRKIASSYFYITDANFKVKKKIKQSKTFKVSQGICYHDGLIYRGSSIAQSKSNYISVYKTNGKYVKNYHYKKKCELEGVFFIGDTLYFTIYKKYKKKKKKHYEAYIKKVKW